MEFPGIPTYPAIKRAYRRPNAWTGIDISLIAEIISWQRERFIRILSDSPLEVQAKIVEGIIQRFPVNSSAKRTQVLADEIHNWIRLLRTSEPVQPPRPKSTSEVVRRALADAEHLIQRNGPTSAVDRIHTAIHGYELELCRETGITVPENSSLTAVFKLLRKHHPALQAIAPRVQEMTTILNAMHSILDALNPIRNNATVAHPNQILIEEEDAHLVINVVRSLFHYLDAKISPRA